jgi:hypothetical protein
MVKMESKATSAVAFGQIGGCFCRLDADVLRAVPTNHKRKYCFCWRLRLHKYDLRFRDMRGLKNLSNQRINSKIPPKKNNNLASQHRFGLR